MTELERRALLGDREAQKQCTEQGIVLPCLKCYGKVKISSVGQNGNRLEMGFRCKRCGLELVYGQYLLKSGMDIFATENPTPLAQWNDRPVPPIGRCGECKSMKIDNQGIAYCIKMMKIVEVDPDYFCGSFRQKESD